MMVEYLCFNHVVCCTAWARIMDLSKNRRGLWCQSDRLSHWRDQTKSVTNPGRVCPYWTTESMYVNRLLAGGSLVNGFSAVVVLNDERLVSSVGRKMTIV